MRHHYLDFLNREPDPGGSNYWANELTSCPPGDPLCINRRRIGVSAAFFVEAEFQRTGNFVYRVYKASLGRRPNFLEFMADRVLVVEGPNLEATKQAFVESWVTRSGFLQQYPLSMDGPGFIDALLLTVQQSSGVNLANERQPLINEWNANHSRARVIRMLVDHPRFAQAEYNAAFVQMQYFGYLRRDPDLSGFEFWLNVLNTADANNYRGMVCAFLTSAEYQYRFGVVRTRTDRECTRDP